MGLYEKAEPLFLRSFRLRKDLYGDIHPSVANAANSLGQFYLNMGNLEQAEHYLLNALAKTKVNMEQISINYVVLLVNLGELYNKKNDITKALYYTEYAVSILKEKVNEKHPVYLIAMNNLILIKSRQKNIDDETDALLIEIKNNFLETYGNKHPSYHLYVNNLAALYMQINRMSEAMVLFNEILEIIGDESPLYLTLCSNLAAF